MEGEVLVSHLRLLQVKNVGKTYVILICDSDIWEIKHQPAMVESATLD